MPQNPIPIAELPALDTVAALHFKAVSRCRRGILLDGFVLTHRDTAVYCDEDKHTRAASVCRHPYINTRIHT